MRIFEQSQPKFAEFGIPTFPVEVTASRKKPLITNYQNIGCGASAKLLKKFGHASAFGFVTGARTHLTILDIDTPCEKLLAQCLGRHGESPLIARTASGKFHVYYAHGGEERLVRPWHDDSGTKLPIDVLGEGMAVAPPSIASSGHYEFINGSLHDIPNLKPMSNLTGQYALPTRSRNSSGAKIQEGNRDAALYNYLMGQAKHCDGIEVLYDLGIWFFENEMDRFSGHEFTLEQVDKKVTHVWNLTQSGQNWFGSGHEFRMHGDEHDRLLLLEPDAHYLYFYVKRKNQGRQTFIVSNALCENLPCGRWSLRRLQKARNSLVKAGLILSIRNPTTATGPELYCWPEIAKTGPH